MKKKLSQKSSDRTKWDKLAHLFHRAYTVDGDLYYRGKILVKGDLVPDEE